MHCVLDWAMIRLPTAPAQLFRTAGDVHRTKENVKRRVCGTLRFTLPMCLLIYLTELYSLPMSCLLVDHRVWREDGGEFTNSMAVYTEYDFFF